MNDILNIIKRSGGYISRQEISDEATYAQLLREVDKGNVIRLKSGVYTLPEELAKPMVDIDRIVPNGVLCLYSAWYVYRLTTQIPVEHYVAVEKSRKVVLPDYPPIKICFWSEKAYEMGIVEMEIEGLMCKIYDVEKSVCDAIRMRNKIGMDVCSEIVRNYMKREDRDLNKLSEYAKTLRVGTTLHNIIQFVI